jgi:SOS-response transcriptional repressor LexA
MKQMSGRDRPSFTPKQGQYLAFIDAYTRVNRRPPAEWEMQRHFGVTPPSVHRMILTLERAGLVRRQPGVPRSIEVLVPPSTTHLASHMQSVKNLCDEGLAQMLPLELIPPYSGDRRM